MTSTATSSDPPGQAVVTGGAGAVGRILLERLGALGYSVHAVDRDPATPTTAAAFGATGHICDVTDEHSVRALPIRGPLAVLINTAGVWPSATVEETSLELWQHVLAVNLTGTFLITRRFLSQLRAAEGRVVNVASAVAFKGNPGMGAYAAAKGGVLALTRVLARELGSAGVRVNAVAPGLLDTEGNRQLLTDAALERALDERCLRRPQTAADAADAVMLFLAPGAALVTGQTLVADGGVALH